MPNKPKNPTKALVVFSGGLDSLLAIKVLEAQGFSVEALSFESPFYAADRARSAAAHYGFRLQVLDVTDEIFSLTQNPPNGFGKNMNPCIDCHGMMFRLAGRYADEQGIQVLASGEVLGQRPFSQTKEALGRVARLAGRDVLRPLSARLMPETSYESSGLVDRGKLLDLSGRSRERQFELAKIYGLDEYPSPGGGCLLTDPGYSKRLRALYGNIPNATPADTRLIRRGRMYWLDYGGPKMALFMIGRDQAENGQIELLAQKWDYVLQLKDMEGPTGLIRYLDADLPAEAVATVASSMEMPKAAFACMDDAAALIAPFFAYHQTRARGHEVAVIFERIN